MFLKLGPLPNLPLVNLDKNIYAMTLFSLYSFSHNKNIYCAFSHGILHQLNSTTPSIFPPDHPTRPFTSLIYKQQNKQLIFIILLVLEERKENSLEVFLYFPLVCCFSCCSVVFPLVYYINIYI